jgi:ADP-ribose pyrophosphatase YjhB (NUDIX family)
LHHAHSDYIVANLWLRSDSNKIPQFSTHNVGVGGVVVNSRNEILLVRELRTNYRPWKLPTGLSELGEHIDVAAEREVWEETGIRTKFHSILGFRQTHGLAYNRSDLFFVCRLDPIEQRAEDGGVVIPEPVAQECEIETASWVPLEEYRAMVNDPEHGHPMMSHVLHVLEAGRQIQRTVVDSVVPGRKPNAIYYPDSTTTDNKTQ